MFRPTSPQRPLFGERIATETEILSGLVPGEAVVVYPGDQIADGVVVASR